MAPHTSGATDVKPKDYLEDGAVDALTPYAAWFSLKDSEKPLEVGDLLMSLDGELRVCKYVGFEQARWVLSEVEPALDTAPVAVLAVQAE